jgi:hypothetical protein
VVETSEEAATAEAADGGVADTFLPEDLAGPVAEVDRAEVEARSQRDLRERAVAWVERHCAEQGVPVKLSDPLALAEIAEILRSGREKRKSDGR